MLIFFSSLSIIANFVYHSKICADATKDFFELVAVNYVDGKSKVSFINLFL